MDHTTELDLIPTGASDENSSEILDTEIPNFEIERCGICMDIIIDRGVLDCCQHWFCFICIDNWGTITNLCPLCQKEFLLITCIPVYDTLGTNKVDENSLFRDDDWCIEGTSSTLSFPSYYIDENAVICLDGDGCKIRNGLANSRGDVDLDTSIACDSCDIWYHAFCVGFDPESSSDGTWLCPRLDKGNGNFIDLLWDLGSYPKSGATALSIVANLAILLLVAFLLFLYKLKAKEDGH